MAPRLTPDEERIVNRYLSVIDFMSRCAQAVDEENTYYLWDKSAQLLGAVEGLKQELDRSGGKPRLTRNGAMVAAIRYHGRHYRAGRLLHPGPVELTRSEVGSILLAVAGGDGLLAEEAALDVIRQSALVIAERTDLRPDAVARVLCALRSWELRDAE
jgi:hypothetical protein